MKLLRLMLVVFAIGISTNSNADAIITIRSAPSCGQWFDAKAKNFNKFWLNGYLSGFAAAKNLDILVVADAPSIFLWMDNYCKLNPLDSVFQGATKLTKELEKKMNK